MAVGLSMLVNGFGGIFWGNINDNYGIFKTVLVRL